MDGKLDKYEICKRLEKAVVSLCKSCLPHDDIAIDAIICLSLVETSEEHVVKIHQTFTANFSDVDDECTSDLDRSGCHSLSPDRPGTQQNDEVVKKPPKTPPRGAWTRARRKRVYVEHDRPNAGATEVCVVSDQVQQDSDLISFCNDHTNQMASSQSGRKHLQSAKRQDYMHHRDVEELCSPHNNGSLLEDRAAVIDFVENSGTTRECQAGQLDTDVNSLSIKTEPLEDIGYGMQSGIMSIGDNSTEYMDNHGIQMSGANGDHCVSNKARNSYCNGSIVTLGRKRACKKSLQESPALLPSTKELTSLPRYNYTVETFHGLNAVLNNSSADKQTQSTINAVDDESDSDNQSLGGSPTDLTNSLISYSLNHILPPDDQDEDDLSLSLPNVSPSRTRLVSQEVQREVKQRQRKSARKFDCRYCGANFTSRRTCIRHEQSTCGYIKFECSVCKKDFSRKDARRRHILKKHGADHLPFCSEASGLQE